MSKVNPYEVAIVPNQMYYPLQLITKNDFSEEVYFGKISVLIIDFFWAPLFARFRYILQNNPEGNHFTQRSVEAKTNLCKNQHN